MWISVKNAYANNLKSISTDIPIGEITALTGVSGSGKSTLLRSVIGAYGANNYTRIAPKTVKDALSIEDFVEVDEIKNLPNTILIDVNSSISNPISTVSTISGIHETLRNLFIDYGEIRCRKCGATVSRDFSLIRNLVVDLKYDEKFQDAITYIEEQGDIRKIEYFDKDGKLTNNEKKKSLVTIYFTLDSVCEKSIREFNRQFSGNICVISDTAGVIYDFFKEIECTECHSVGPNLLRSRMSYSTEYDKGGGACRCCHGTGKTISIKSNNIFTDKTKGILDGASQFVTTKGIKYSTISEKFIEAIYDKFKLDIGTPIEKLPEKVLNVLLNGMESETVFLDRKGGQKKLVFEGITSYLDAAYRAHKGGEALANLFDESICNACWGSRFDSDISCFVVAGTPINSLMRIKLSELGEWCEEVKKNVPKKAINYLDRVIKETNNSNLLSCGHLTLLRSSNTLSGGELQRIRICALLNSNIHGLCYLLDEPSSGLHYSDIENLAMLFKEICAQGNTIIMVEHNKKMLSYCNHIIDMGPFGGFRGGNILFNAPLSKIDKYDTATTRILRDKSTTIQATKPNFSSKKEFLEFNDLSYNNLKNISVRIPRNCFTAICGVSGSGKSTLVKNAVLDSIKRNPKEYGFDGIDYIGQLSKVTSNLSTVASLVKINDYIAKLFEKASKYKLKKNCFILGSAEGKCQCCGGRGSIYSSSDEFLGMCDQCNGYGFIEDVLRIRVDGLNIFEFYNTNLEDLGAHVKDPKIKSMAELGCRLGIAYLNFARRSKTLSNGELQRVSLMRILIGKEKNHLLILDEPSRGLHVSDTLSLVDTLNDITKLGNTVMVVEHNPDIIRQADYIIELGGTGTNGGYLLFQGVPKYLSNTPTAKMLENFEVCGAETAYKKSKEIFIDDKKHKIKYAPNALHSDHEHMETLLKAAKKSRDDFLSVAIPNNSMFSRLDRNTIVSDTPIMMIIDFREKINYSISVCEALDIRGLLCKAVASESAETIAKYVFDLNSSTGKCLNCKGTGKVLTIDMDYFLQEGELNNDCKKFLKNSTNYVKLSKLLKKDGIDIIKSVKMMMPEEQRTLFWGSDSFYDVDGKSRRWEGIIPYFIQFHKYYPAKSAENIFVTKSECVCPICRGERIKAKHMGLTCCGRSYREWMSLPIGRLLETIRQSGDNYIKKISERLNILCNLGLCDLTLSDELYSMDAIVAGKIKLASFYVNRIYGVGLIINNLDSVIGKEKSFIKDMLESMSATCTVWIVG